MVPEEIKKVPRPPNTIVINSGVTSERQYKVRQKLGYKKGSNGKFNPTYGPVIGYIVDGMFKLRSTELAADGHDFKVYGSPALMHKLSSDLMSDLLDVYDVTSAYRIMALAQIKIFKPQAPFNRYKGHYERSFISEFLPYVKLSANTISSFLSKLGQDLDKRNAFYQKRLQHVQKDHHLLIDGTIVDNSVVNSFSHYSYKDKVKSSKNLSLLYAYDLELKEPVCAKAFKGNSIDIASFDTFVKEHDIAKGILTADKGFSVSVIRNFAANNLGISYLVPLKRNDIRIRQYNLTSFENVLPVPYENVICKKVCVNEGRYLYSFRDLNRYTNECSTYLSNSSRKNSFDAAEYEKTNDIAGVICFESDLDEEPLNIYLSYDSHLTQEVFFDHVKNDLMCNSASLQTEYSIIGSELVNFIASVISCRIINLADKLGLFQKNTYMHLMEDLEQTLRRTNAGSLKADAGDSHWLNASKRAFDLLIKMEVISTDLIPVEVSASPKPKGRPRTRPAPIPPELFIGPKRRRGRPKKLSS